MKSRFGFSNVCLILRCGLFLAVAFAHSYVLAKSESSSSYFSDDDSALELDQPVKAKPSKKPKRSTTNQNKTVEAELTIDDVAPKKNRKSAKRISTPANLRFDKDRLNKVSELSLEPDGPRETVITETEVTPEVQHRISQAEEFEKTKRWPEIITTLKPVTESLNRTGLLLLASGFAGTKNAAEEVRILDLVRNKYPKDYVALTRLGLALSKVKKNPEALQALYDAKEANQRYQPAYEALLNQLELMGNSYEAHSLVEDMIERFGKVPRYFTTLCRLLTKDAFLDKAVEMCEIATQKDPKVPENYVNLAIAQKDKLEPSRAIATIDDAAGKFPLSEKALVTQGQLHLDKNDFAGAAVAFQKATAFAVRSLPAWIGYARASFELHKYKESLDAFIRACKIDPHSSTAFREMAGRLHKDKNTDWEYKFRDAISTCGAGA